MHIIFMNSNTTATPVIPPAHDTTNNLNTQDSYPQPSYGQVCLDPETFSVTNTFPYSDIHRLMAQAFLSHSTISHKDLLEIYIFCLRAVTCRIPFGFLIYCFSNTQSSHNSICNYFRILIICLLIGHQSLSWRAWV